MGLLEPAGGPAPAGRGDAISIDRVRTIVAPDGARIERRAPRSASSCSLRTRSRRRSPRPASSLPAAGRSRHRGSRRQHRGAGDAHHERRRAASHVAVPGPHEHLRRPRATSRCSSAAASGAGSAFELGTAGPGDAARARRARPLLHGRRPGSRPGTGRTRPGREQARGARGGARARAPRCWRSAAATSCSGTPMQVGDESLPGLGLVDLRTVREPGERLIGNVVIETDLGTGRAAWPASRTTAAAPTSARRSRPLGRVVSGFGNNGKDGAEGVRRGRLIGTYLHGPLLPKNAWLADVLIGWALARRTGTVPELEPLDDRLEDAAHASAARRWRWALTRRRSSRTRPHREPSRERIRLGELDLRHGPRSRAARSGPRPRPRRARCGRCSAAGSAPHPGSRRRSAPARS